MFGLESILIKKGVWPEGVDVMHGALLRDGVEGHNYFVTSGELADLLVDPDKDSG